MATILVTGGAGFIGSHLCEYLLLEKNKVICVDNFITGRRENIENLLTNPNFSLIEKDITQSLDSLTEKIDCIFHLASPASPPQYQKYAIETLLTNSQGTKNVLDIAIKNKAKILLASTSEVYGDPAVHPQPETYWGNVNPIGIRACYDEGKRFAETITMEYVRKKNCHAVITRIFNTYGPKMDKDDGRVVSNFCYAATHKLPIIIYGDGKQTRSFCYVSDMVKGLAQVMQNGEKGQVYNVGNPDEKSVARLAQMIQILTQTDSQIEYKEKPKDDPARRKPDITKIKKLGWDPKISLEEGLKKTIEYFKNI